MQKGHSFIALESGHFSSEVFQGPKRSLNWYNLYILPATESQRGCSFRNILKSVYFSIFELVEESPEKT